MKSVTYVVIASALLVLCIPLSVNADEWAEQEILKASELVDKDQIPQAIAMLERSLANARQIKGKNSDTYASILAETGQLCILTGDNKKAGSYLKQALTIKEKLYGPKHQQVGNLLIDMGHISMMKEKYNEAEGLFQRALTIQKAVKNEGAIQEVYLALSELYQMQGKEDKAKEMRDKGGFDAGEDIIVTGGRSEVMVNIGELGEDEKFPPEMPKPEKHTPIVAEPSARVSEPEKKPPVEAKEYTPEDLGEL